MRVCKAEEQAPLREINNKPEEEVEEKDGPRGSPWQGLAGGRGDGAHIVRRQYADSERSVYINSAETTGVWRLYLYHT